MKKYKSIVYKIQGVQTEQIVLSDLDTTLNQYSNEGWETVSVQLIGTTEYLIIFVKEE